MQHKSETVSPADSPFFPLWGWFVVCAAGALSYLSYGTKYVLTNMMLAAMLLIGIRYLKTHGSTPISPRNPASFRIVWWTIGAALVASIAGIIVSGSPWGALLGLGGGALGGFFGGIFREAHRNSLRAAALHSDA